MKRKTTKRKAKLKRYALQLGPFDPNHQHLVEYDNVAEALGFAERWLQSVGDAGHSLLIVARPR